MTMSNNRKDRLKLQLLVTIGLLGAFYGILVGVLSPIRARRDASAQAVDQLRDNVRKAEISLSRMERNRQEHIALLVSLSDQSERYLLHPRLGNYLLGARERIEREARRAGIPAPTVTEVGLMSPPRAGQGTGNPVLQAYAARAVFEAGYEELWQLLRGMETANPLLCLGGLQIAVQPEKPGRHAVTMEAHWPAWYDPAMAEIIQGQAAEAQTRGEGGRADAASDGNET